MLKLLLLALFCSSCCCFQLSTIKNHHHLMEQRRKTEKSLSLLPIETKYIKQPIDNFNASDSRHWAMMYAQNLEKWTSGGPIYIYIGGESTLDPHWLTAGLIYELAEETDGAMFATEHRYYGESAPFTEPTVAELEYLTIRQALADLANFIKQIKNSAEFSASKVVVIGGSYPGCLAAWMRLKYPELVDAAVASSAPVLAKLDAYEYLDTVADDFQKYTTPECFHSITENIDNCSEALKTKHGIKQLKHQYNICDGCDMTDKINQEEFFVALIYKYRFAAQYGTTDYIHFFCNISESIEKSDCSKCDKDDKCDFSHLDSNSGCQTEAESTSARLWRYQSCRESISFLTAPNKPPFTNITLDVDYWVRKCGVVFGPQFTRENIERYIEETNSAYGGLNPAVTNVVFVNGELDPWRRLGVTADLSETAPARVIPGASHCNDLFSDNSVYVTDAVRKVKNEEKAFIKKWIGL